MHHSILFDFQIIHWTQENIIITLLEFKNISFNNCLCSNHFDYFNFCFYLFNTFATNYFELFNHSLVCIKSLDINFGLDF